VIGSVKELYETLSPVERWRTLKLLLLLLVLALLEAIGVASIMPFMAVLASPDTNQTDATLAAVSEWTGVTSTDHLLLLTGGLVFILFISALVLQALVVWAQKRYAMDLMHSWSCQVVETYLHQPYEWFLARHTSELSITTVNEANQVINHFVLPVLVIASNGLVALAIFAFLLIADPVLAATIVVVLAGVYTLVYRFLRTRLLQAGESFLLSNRRRYNVLAEAFGGIKEVKVSHAEKLFAQQFESASRRACDSLVLSSVMERVPSIAMQAVVFGGMLLVVLYVVATRGGFAAGLPMIGLFAFAGYKMMPALQRIYSQVAVMKFSSAALRSLCLALRPDKKPALSLETSPAWGKMERGVRLRKRLEFRDVVYRYPGNDHPTLDRMSLSIRAGSKVGIVGSTGSGKTTVVDIILGLLRPSAGKVCVDGEEIGDAQIRAWQASVGYVSQTVFLADTTLADNIAFGLPKDQIDLDRVEAASKLANLHTFVFNELPERYESRVGERGVRLSGGQRQRVGIARALYHDPDILILDEGTSALDNVTEGLVMQALDKLGPSKTVVIIAHRLSTVKNCDTIFFLEHGVVTGRGTFQELRATHTQFRLLTGEADAQAPL